MLLHLKVVLVLEPLLGHRARVALGLRRPWWTAGLLGAQGWPPRRALTPLRGWHPWLPQVTLSLWWLWLLELNVIHHLLLLLLLEVSSHQHLSELGVVQISHLWPLALHPPPHALLLLLLLQC